MLHRLPLLVLLLAVPAWADEPLGPTPKNFDYLHRRIKPQPGEALWLGIPWEIDLHQARQKAAAAGKPIFVMSGGGATAIGPC